MKYLMIALLAVAPSTAAFALNYSESVNGDLSGNENAPTQLTFNPGVNSVSGVMGRDEPGDPVDRDFFTFTLAPGQSLTSINVLQFDPIGSSFYAIAAGTSINITDPANHLSNILVSGPGEILDDLDASSYSGGIGLNAPLGSGTYTIWFQELASVVTYDFNYTVVPEPAALGAFGITIGILRRRRN